MNEKTEEVTEEAISKDEMTTVVIPQQHGYESPNHSTAPAAGGHRSAFTELMSRKSKSSLNTPIKNTSTTRPPLIFSGRDGLGAYLSDPTAFPPSRIIYHTPKWVVIRDMYPKSSVHILLLPRDGTKNLLHPFEAFEDRAFLEEVQSETKKLRILVAKELQRLYGRFSAQEEQKRRRRIEESYTGNEAGAKEEKEKELEGLQGRDWEKEILSGIHARPSMTHLHIHILSKDRYSECMNKRPHYNSFATPFLIPVEEFPLKKDDPRRYPSREGYLDRDLVCWRCGRNFKKKFGELKEHLKMEFEEWKRE
ncbi:MAG: hypothetical protein M1823_002424 [Watsoniomyces obsoletus]|nr:MAG: hypothetical protein M1823_002424 [Watsoniomyces obsoletus]